MSAFQTMYRDEFIAMYEKRQSVLSNTVTTEALIKGHEAVFLVAGSGGRTAVTRGANGDIPTATDSLTQYTATLKEWHDIPERTGFNIFESQGDARKIMQQTSLGVINRKVDEQIVTALSAATVTTGAAATASLTLVNKAKVKLGNAFADEDELYAVITPAFHAYLMALPQFASNDYIKSQPFEMLSKDKAFSWYGVRWVVDGSLPGAGTNSATCYMYGKSAIGHAIDRRNIQTVPGYDDKQDKSYVRVSAFMGAKLLQNSGVVKMVHDDSALS